MMVRSFSRDSGAILHITVSGSWRPRMTVVQGLLIVAVALGASLVSFGVGSHPFAPLQVAAFGRPPPGAALSQGLGHQHVATERDPQADPLQITPHSNTRVLIPALDNGDGWETEIDVQNVGTEYAKAVMFVWGEYSGSCGVQALGPIWALCTGLLRPGSAWTWGTRSIPSSGRSGIIYSVDFPTSDVACEEASDSLGSVYDWRRWESTYEGTGESIAVSVNRIGPAQTPGLTDLP